MRSTDLHADRLYPLHGQRRGCVHGGSGAPHNEQQPTSMNVRTVHTAMDRCASGSSAVSVGGCDTLPQPPPPVQP
jgi:hypothetical protein